MDVGEFMGLFLVAAITGFVILAIAYFAAFRVFGYRHLRPGVGRIALIHLLSWWLMAAMVAVGYPLGIADIPDPGGPLVMVVIFHAALAVVTYVLVTRPARRPALLLPLFPSILFAIVIAASMGH